MSVYDGSRKYYANDDYLTEYWNYGYGHGLDDGVSFVEDKFAYWTSECRSSNVTHRWQEHFLRASLNGYQDSPGKYKPYLRLNYEFS